MEREEEVFLDAEEEVTPRRPGRKRRSTAGSISTATATKKSRPARKMPVERSPGTGRNAGNTPQQKTASPGKQGAQVPPGNPDAFWARMGGLLDGLEGRLKSETTDVKEQLSKEIGDLGDRVERTERRLDRFADEVDHLVEEKLAKKWGVGRGCPTSDQGPQEPHFETGGAPLASCSKSYASVLQGGPKILKKRSPARTKEEEYWDCRRALRLRPVLPDDNAIEAALKFMQDHLRLDADFIRDIGPIQVQRVPSGPWGKV